MQMTFFLVAWRVHCLDTAFGGSCTKLGFVRLFDMQISWASRQFQTSCDLRYAYCYCDFWANMATCHFGDVASCKKLYLAASWQCLAGLVSLLGADAECDFLVSELQLIVFISFGLREMFRLVRLTGRKSIKREPQTAWHAVFFSDGNNDGNINVRCTILVVGGGCMESFSKRPCSGWNHGV